MAWYW